MALVAQTHGREQLQRLSVPISDGGTADAQAWYVFLEFSVYRIAMLMKELWIALYAIELWRACQQMKKQHIQIYFHKDVEHSMLTRG